MLRRSHDHHRGVRTRCNAAASVYTSNEPNQDRHLMTASQSCKCAPHARWLSIGRGDARPRVPPSPQSSDNLSSSTPPATHPSATSPSPNSWHRLDPNQPSRPRHSNPHSACGTADVPLSAVSSLGGFRTPAAEYATPSLKRPASETLHKGRHSPTIIRPLAANFESSGRARRNG